MLTEFQPGELPGREEEAKVWPADIASWYKVWATAEWVFERCVKNANMAGWDYAGKRPSLYEVRHRSEG